MKYITPDNLAKEIAQWEKLEKVNKNCGKQKEDNLIWLNFNIAKKEWRSYVSTNLRRTILKKGAKFDIRMTDGMFAIVINEEGAFTKSGTDGYLASGNPSGALYDKYHSIKYRAEAISDTMILCTPLTEDKS